MNQFLACFLGTMTGFWLGYLSITTFDRFQDSRRDKAREKARQEALRKK